MSKHNFPIDIIVDNEYIKICNDFVEKSHQTNITHYAKRKQNDTNKIKHDIYCGKLAEFAVYQYLSKSSDLTKPDVQVYESYHKSFDADLIIDYRHNLHVKSQHIHSASSFGMSWNFQKEDLLTVSPTDNDFICLCIVHSENKVTIMAMKKATNLVTFYRDPVLEKLKGIKKVLYYSDLVV